MAILKLGRGNRELLTPGAWAVPTWCLTMVWRTLGGDTSLQLMLECCRSWLLMLVNDGAIRVDELERSKASKVVEKPPFNQEGVAHIWGGPFHFTQCNQESSSQFHSFNRDSPFQIHTYIPGVWKKCKKQNCKRTLRGPVIVCLASSEVVEE